MGYASDARKLLDGKQINYRHLKGTLGRESVAVAMRREGMRAELGGDLLFRDVVDAEERAGDGNVPGCSAPLTSYHLVTKTKRGGRLVEEMVRFPNPCRCDHCRARRRAERVRFEARALFDAADEYQQCGRTWVHHDCTAGCGGYVQTRRRCALATICPDCARAESGRLSTIYTARARAQLAGALKGIRPRMVTLALRPNGTETLVDAVERCRAAGKLTLRVLFGIPASKTEWRIYFAVYPVTPAELERAGGRPRAANAARRRAVKANRLRQAAGWLVASEFGARGMKAHVHALVLGRYVEQRELSKCWRIASGGSFVADIRKAYRVREVTKYAVKLIDRPPEELAQLYRATCGRRRVEAFGCLRGPVEGEEGERDALVCPKCGAAVVATGVLSHTLKEMGVERPPPEFRFRGIREGPT